MDQIILKEYEDYNEEEIVTLYKSVHWSLYVNHPEKLKKSYDHSLYTLAAYEGERLVGMIRVVGDGVSIIFIQDLLVHPDYRRKGIGQKLITAVLEKYKNVRQKALLTDNMPILKSFYRSVGLVPIEEKNGVCFVSYSM